MNVKRIKVGGGVLQKLGAGLKMDGIFVRSSTGLLITKRSADQNVLIPNGFGIIKAIGVIFVMKKIINRDGIIVVFTTTRNLFFQVGKFRKLT